MTSQQITALFDNLKNNTKTAEVLTGIARKHRVSNDDLLTFLHDIKIPFDQKVSSENLQNPDGYLVASIKNRIRKEYRNKKRDVATEFMAQIPDQWVEEFETGGKSTNQKIHDLFKLLEPVLPKRLKQLVSIMAELADGDYPSYEHYIHAVKIRAMENGISGSYFYKLCERLRDHLRPLRDQANQMLHSIRNNDEAKIAEFMIESEGQVDEACSCTGLEKMKFSKEEEEAIKWLQQLSKDNGFNADTLPDIYYDTLENVKTLCPECVPPVKKKDEKNPDTLGVYCRFVTQEEDEISETLPKKEKEGKLNISQEGIIILFSDRIENYCNNDAGEIDKCKYLVLMHELGHWLSHWPFAEEKRWELGYYGKDYNGKEQPNPSYVHEGLAQLIAFWSTDGKKEHRSYFEKQLTPTDLESEYAAYIKLTNQHPNNVFRKIIQLRKYAGVPDAIAFEFMKAKECDFHQWAAEYVFQKACEALKFTGEKGKLATINLKHFKSTELKILIEFYVKIENYKNKIFPYCLAHEEISKTNVLNLPSCGDTDAKSGGGLLNRFLK
jgi:hypothetical protein